MKTRKPHLHRAGHPRRPAQTLPRRSASGSRYRRLCIRSIRSGTPIDYRYMPMSPMTNSNFQHAGVPSTLVSSGCRKAGHGALQPLATTTTNERREDANRGTKCGNPKARKTGVGPDRTLFATRMCDLYRTCASNSAPVYTLAGVGSAILLQRRCARDLHRDRPVSHDTRRPPRTAEYRGPQLLQSFLVRGAQSRCRRVTEPIADQTGFETRHGEAKTDTPAHALTISKWPVCRKRRRHALPG
jgi:hypothetical protein